MSWLRWAVGFMICGTMVIVSTVSSLGLTKTFQTEVEPLPPIYDLRNEGYPFAVMDQRTCQMGYVLAATEQFQAAIWQKENQVLQFSVNQAKECNWSAFVDYINPCVEGNLLDIVNLFTTQGVVAESCNPLFYGDGECVIGCPPLYQLSGWLRLSTNQIAEEDTIKSALLTYGPVYTKINTDLEGFLLYDGSGVLYDLTSYSTVNHALLIVGWDDTRSYGVGSGVWIVKNSYGPGWGDDGYAYIAYGSGGIGKESSVITSWIQSDPNSHLYYYDQAGFKTQITPGNLDTEAYMMTLFTTQRAEVIQQIELWTTDAAVVSIFVYDRFSNGELKDLLLSIPDVSIAGAGYHAVPVTTNVELGAYDEVAVVAHIRNQKNIFPLAVDHISNYAVGKNWLSEDGVNWITLDPNGFSANMGLRLRTTLPDPPPQPSGFVISAATQSTLRLNWQAMISSCQGFLLERRNPTTLVWERIADLDPSNTTYLDAGLSADTAYHYRLSAYNLGGLSQSAETQGNTLPNAPEAPSDINAVILSPASVRLEWTDQSNNETGFRIERQIVDGVWVKIGQVEQNKQVFIDDSIAAGLTYRYRVIAYNAGGDSPALVSTSVLIPNWPFWICLPMILN